MTVSSEMPRYQSHKQVWALKILSVQSTEHPFLVPVDQRFRPIPVSKEWLEKHKPEAGSYFVLYEAGYKSYSPGDVFESGHTLIQ